MQFEDIKPDNVLVNYGQGDVRFTEVQLADCGSTVAADSAYAKNSDLIGAPIWRSPEAQLRIGWGTPTDIWSFGVLACSYHSTLLNISDFSPGYNPALWRQFLSVQARRSRGS